ncbi:MAG TPA: hypothetical protein VGF04_06460 [Solirubrobacterales bacterium]|jgi:hypothetical protein
MSTSREEVLDRERRWALPAALAALAAIGFVVASLVVVSGTIGGSNGESDYLRTVDAHQGGRMTSAILQAIGVGLLAIPLYYLFRAAEARSPNMRGQLVGVVVAGPIFLAIASVLTGISSIHAADDFVTNSVPHLAGELGSDHANDVATEALDDASLRGLAAGFGIGGQLGLAVGMVYTVLHAMRTGLVTRFWGSLGMALGVVSFFPQLLPFTLLWFVYLGLVISGRLPRGRPPAWAAGEAIPWPSPGEQASAALEASEPAEAEEPDTEPADTEPAEPPRKRKQRE